MAFTSPWIHPVRAAPRLLKCDGLQPAGSLRTSRSVRRTPVAPRMQTGDPASAGSQVGSPTVSPGIYQLNELEDNCSTTTAIILRDDHAVDVCETDGPIPASAKGEWTVTNDGNPQFVMQLSRSYDGDEEFPFLVERTYQGDVSVGRGGLLEIDGAVLGEVVAGEPQAKIGFFKVFPADDDLPQSQGE